MIVPIIYEIHSESIDRSYQVGDDWTRLQRKRSAVQSIDARQNKYALGQASSQLQPQPGYRWNHRIALEMQGRHGHCQQVSFKVLFRLFKNSPSQLAFRHRLQLIQMTGFAFIVISDHSRRGRAGTSHPIFFILLAISELFGRGKGDLKHYLIARSTMSVQAVEGIANRLALIEAFGNRSAECKVHVGGRRKGRAFMAVDISLTLEANEAKSGGDAIVEKVVIPLVSQQLTVWLPARAIKKFISLSGLEKETNVAIQSVHYEIQTGVEYQNIEIDISEYEVTVTLPYKMNFLRLKQYLRCGDWVPPKEQYESDAPKRVSTEIVAINMFEGAKELYALVNEYAATHHLLRSFLALCQAGGVRMNYKSPGNSTDVTDLLLDDGPSRAVASSYPMTSTAPATGELSQMIVEGDR
jgi:hypothetical protein